MVLAAEPSLDLPLVVFLLGSPRLSYSPASRAERAQLMAVCWVGVVMLFFTFSTTQEYYVSADLKWSQFSRFKCEPLRSPAVRMHTPALAAIWKPQRSRLRVLQHELSVHTCSSRAIHSCPCCGIPVASIFVSTDREAGRNSSALRTAAPERMQGPWPERWSGWKVLTAGDPTFSRRFT